MRRVLVALCLCAFGFVPQTRADDPSLDEGFTTWVRKSLDEQMNLQSKLVEGWIGSLEGTIDVARIGYSVGPEVGHVLNRSPITPLVAIFSPDSSAAAGQQTTVKSAGPSGPLSNHADVWGSGGTAMIGYRYASDIEFFFDFRALDLSDSHTDPGDKTTMFNTRFATRMNFSFDAWRLSAMASLRGLYSVSRLSLAGTDLSQSTTSTSIDQSGAPPLVTIDRQSTSLVGTERASNVYGAGPELGFGIERDFLDDGPLVMTVYARPRVATICADVERAITYLEFGNVVSKSSSTQWFLETGLSLGATWRSPTYPRFQMRFGYEFEEFLALNRKQFGQASFLTGHNFIVGVDYSF